MTAFKAAVRVCVLVGLLAGTALAVNIATYPTHIASMPVAVNVCCHAARHASVTL